MFRGEALLSAAPAEFDVCTTVKLAAWRGRNSMMRDLGRLGHGQVSSVQVGRGDLLQGLEPPGPGLGGQHRG